MNLVKSEIGFIGLGVMGAPIARHLISSGFKLLVYDINPDVLDQFSGQPVRLAKSPVDVANGVATVLVSMPNTSATLKVTMGSDGIMHGTKIKTYIDLSTTGSVVAKKVAKVLEEKGIASLDSPVTGGIAGAINGNLTVMVSGPRDAYDQSEAIYKAFSKLLFFVGEGAGQAQVVKVINNLLSATALAVTSEAFVLGAKAGIDANILLDVINNGTGKNSATEDKFPRSVLPRKFDHFARTEIIYKDVCLCLEEAEDLGVPMWVGTSVKQLWAFAMSQGAAMDDMTTLVKHLEKLVGVEVRGKEAV